LAIALTQSSRSLSAMEIHQRSSASFTATGSFSMPPVSSTMGT
jgi:hypothetical protein